MPTATCLRQRGHCTSRFLKEKGPLICVSLIDPVDGASASKPFESTLADKTYEQSNTSHGQRYNAMRRVTGTRRDAFNLYASLCARR
jgi:hypothetical protein